MYLSMGETMNTQYILDFYRTRFLLKIYFRDT